MLQLKELSLPCLRSSLGAEQRAILEKVAHYHRDHKEWMPAPVLYLDPDYNAKEQIYSIFDGLCGSLIWEVEDSQVGNRYELRPLARFAIDDGKHCEDLLLKYLSFVRKRARTERYSRKIGSDAVQSDLGLHNSDLILLCSLLRENSFSHGGGMLGDSTFEVGWPAEVEDIPSDPSSYMQERLFRDFDAGMPVIRSKLNEYFHRNQPSLSPTSYYQGGFFYACPPYVSKVRIDELKTLKSDYDLSKLVRLCEELNAATQSSSYYSMAFLLRTILDHVPPLFSCTDFSQVAANHRGGRSFKDNMQNLQTLLRKIADLHLHNQMKRKETTFPDEKLLHYASTLDILLGEIVSVASGR